MTLLPHALYIPFMKSQYTFSHKLEYTAFIKSHIAFIYAFQINAIHHYFAFNHEFQRYPIHKISFTKKQDMSFIKSHCALIRSIQTSNSLLEMHICCRTLLVLPSRERVPLQR